MKVEKRIKTIFEKVYVETPLDTDGDGKLDMIAVWITRPESTLNGGDKVPAVFCANSYLMTCNEEMYNLHNVDHELEIFNEDDKQVVLSKRKDRDILAHGAKRLRKPEKSAMQLRMKSLSLMRWLLCTTT